MLLIAIRLKNYYMSNKISAFLCIIIIFIFSAWFVSCSKKDAASNPPPPPPPDICASKTITINATPASANICTASGSITATATGSTGFMFKLNSTGTYQASGSFSNLNAGTYTVFAKDGDGCEKSASVTVSSDGTAGTLFTSVRNLITARCQSCHNNTIQNGGMNWAVDCNIVVNQARIKVRAVTQGTMPPTGSLSQADKDIITNWINAGGKFTD